MLKKILCALMAAMLLLSFVSCASSCKKDKENGSSKKPKPTVSVDADDGDVSSDLTSSSITVGEEPGDDDDTSSYWPYEWTIQTKSAFFRDTEEAKTSATTSGGIKKYKYNGGLMLGAYHLSMMFCDSLGTDINTRGQEFADIVNAGYFNTYLLPLDTNILTEAKLIAENGGTIWFAPGPFNSGGGVSSVADYKEKIRYYKELLEKNGYGDIVLGCHWDEPIWRQRIGQGMSNADYLSATKATYELGLRTFPVFTTMEFTEIEGNENIIEQLKPDGKYDDDTLKINRSSLKYTTDIGWDTYSVDIRDGAPDANISDKWKNLYPEIVDGKSYYQTITKKLMEHVPHDFNLWYFATAYTCGVNAGLGGIKEADEDFCLALLDYLAKDLVTREYAGGIFVYSYHHGTIESKEKSLNQLLPIKNEYGEYKYFPQQAKWSRYATRLKEVRQLFDQTKSVITPYKVAV